jgi:hypothetical protein
MGLMNILTWHGAVLRLDLRRNRLVQDPLWLTGEDGADFAFDPDGSKSLTTPVGIIDVVTSGRGNSVRLRHLPGAGGQRPGRSAPHT